MQTRRVVLKMAAGAGAALALRGRAMAAKGNEDISAIRSAEGEKTPLLKTPRAIDIPIIVYHHVVPDQLGSQRTRILYVAPDIFEQQLNLLRDNGYQSVSFSDVADCLEYGIALPERPVILSFDDGWDNQFNFGFPLLQKYGFTGTFFIVSGFLDHQNFMTTDQLKAMVAAGMTIGGHSRTHPALAGLGAMRLQDEIAGSKLWLRERLGVPIDTFAYPYGSYTASVAAIVKSAGYRTARTVDVGTHCTADNLETLPGLIFSTFANHYRDKIEIASRDDHR
jgi:peptidoglycan/xylan/chitin deacetylase (PgdA/CDA1 family)